MTEIDIRPITPGDLPAIADIWNRMIRDSAATFTSVEKTPEVLAGWLAEGLASGHPRLAAIQSGALVGFASASPFRAGPGYARTLEHSIILADTATGRGIGRDLLGALEDAATKADAHSLVAGISGENTAAIAFHARMGFSQVGRLPEAGFKFGRWMDLVLMQKLL